MSDTQVTKLVTCPRCEGRMSPVAGGDGYYACACGASCHESTATNEAVREGYRKARARDALQHDPNFPNPEERSALIFLFKAAHGCSGGETRCRKLLFAWHNARDLGGFDLTDLWSLDERHLSAALTLIRMIARGPHGWYASHYGFESDMEALIEQYAETRPDPTCTNCGCTRDEHGEPGLLNGCDGFRS